MPSILIIGATRGLGAHLLQRYASNPSNTVYGTSRTASPPTTPTGPNIHWIPSIDLTSPDCGHTLASALTSKTIHTTLITAGYFRTETLSTPSFTDQLQMYTISAIAPSLLISALVTSSIIPSSSPSPSSSPQSSPPSKILLITSESGSIHLRHAHEGGANYGHHGSKAASNMVAKLLAIDLAPRNIAVAAVHPGFMRTEMTRGVGFDRFWDEGGAREPAETAEILVRWVDGVFGMEEAGRYWAPGGTGDIGTWGVVMGEGTGKGKGGAVELPW